MTKRAGPSKQPRSGSTPASATRVEPLLVEMAAEAQRRIRQHARSSMNAEICGVLIGTAETGKTIIEDVIAGEGARQAGAHVTFTQETWAHVYEVKDENYPEKRIVGWYHSHPNFGVFLSEHDLFIHQNFFSDPNQIAWVFDPHSDEEGCFAWEGEEIVRLGRIAVESPERSGVDREFGDPKHENSPDKSGKSSTRSARSPLSSITKWALLTASHVAALILGLALALILFPSIIVLSPLDYSTVNTAKPTDRPAQRELTGSRSAPKKERTR